MKDLAFLLLTLALVAGVMMMAQGRYRGAEAETNRNWKRERFERPVAVPESPTLSPTPLSSP